MAKELPYFKFEPAEYLTKDISFCSLSAQGLFINICSYYWQRNCSLTKEQLLKRLNYEIEFNELIKEGVIDIQENNIIIKFLDNQLNSVEEKSKTNSSNGSKGGRPRKNPNESEIKPNENQNESKSKGIREDEIKEEYIFEINNDILEEKGFLELFNKCRNYYDKMTTNLESLQSVERSLLNNQNKTHDKQYFIDALNGFYSQKNMFISTRIRPKHFLENLELYNTCFHEKKQLFPNKEIKTDRL